MTLTKQAQFILDEIARRYDQGYASRIRSMTEFKLSVAYPEEGLLQLVALYQVMDEEGFSQSERGAIFGTLFEDVTHESLSLQAWAEVLDMPVYGMSKFSSEVSEELRRFADHGPIGELD